MARSPCSGNRDGISGERGRPRSGFQVGYPRWGAKESLRTEVALMGEGHFTVNPARSAAKVAGGSFRLNPGFANKVRIRDLS